MKPEYCSKCEFCRISPEYYNPDFDEDDQDLFCTKLNKNTHEELHWTEIAGLRTINQTGIDTPPEDCPL